MSASAQTGRSRTGIGSCGDFRQGLSKPEHVALGVADREFLHPVCVLEQGSVDDVRSISPQFFVQRQLGQIFSGVLTNRGMMDRPSRLTIANSGGIPAA
jgi:hypothetical protein